MKICVHDREEAACADCRIYVEPQKLPILHSDDVVEYIRSGHMADKTIPRWFKGTVAGFVQLYGRQAYDQGTIDGNCGQCE